MVQERENIDVQEFVWDFGANGNVEHLALHDIEPADANAVLRGAPLFFGNLPGRRASHIMIGQDARARSLYIALQKTAEDGVWTVVTGWQSRVAHQILEREGLI